MLNICLFISLICASTIICRAFFIKDTFQKILFFNTGTSVTALFICFLGSFEVNSSYIDIALIYFLLSSIAMTAYLKYFLSKNEEKTNK